MISDLAIDSKSLLIIGGSVVLWIGFSAEAIDEVDGSSHEALKFPASMQIFSKKYLSGFLVLYDPVENQNQKMKCTRANHLKEKKN